MRTLPSLALSVGAPAAVALALLAAAPAQAARVSRFATESLDGELTIVFTAAPGEANRLTVSEDGRLFNDAANPVAAGKGCRQVDANTARCGAIVFGPEVRLRDGDDEVTLLSAASVAGGDGDDTITAIGAHDDDLYGGGGDDRIDAGDGTDGLTGGPGRDELHGGAGGDSFFDEPDASAQPDVIDGGDGEDEIRYDYRTRPVAVDLGAGRGDGGDRLAGIEGAQGGEGSDRLTGGDEADSLFGREGDDVIVAGGGDDLVSGDAGNDRLAAGDGDDTVYGGGGDDRLDAGAGADRISATSDLDGLGADRIACGPGADRVRTDARDTLEPGCEEARIEAAFRITVQPAIRAGTATFRLRCYGGRARLALRGPGGADLGTARFRCRDRLRRLRVVLTPAGRTAVDRRTPVTVDLRGPFDLRAGYRTVFERPT